MLICACHTIIKIYPAYRQCMKSKKQTPNLRKHSFHIPLMCSPLALSHRLCNHRWFQRIRNTSTPVGHPLSLAAPVAHPKPSYCWDMRCITSVTFRFTVYPRTVAHCWGRYRFDVINTCGPAIINQDMPKPTSVS